jgi:hypothetical protein
MSATDDVNNVPNHRARGRGDDTDAPGEGGHRTLSIRVKKSFTEQACFELFEGKLKRAGATRLHCLGNKLKLTSALVHRNAPTNQHCESVGGAKAQEAGLATEEDNGELRLAVL